MSDSKIQWRGTVLYDWVPFFKEIAAALAKVGGKPRSARDNKMEELAREIFQNGPIVDTKLGPVTPFTFVYTLASKNAAKDRIGFFDRAKAALAVDSDIPTDSVFPTPKRNTIVGKTSTKITAEYVDEMWQIFAKAISAKGLTDQDFSACLKRDGIGLANLSQTLFLIAPERYLPLDENSALPLLAIFPPELGLENVRSRQAKVERLIRNGSCQFHDLMGYIFEQFPGGKPYEINRFAWQHQKRKFDDPSVQKFLPMLEFKPNGEGVSTNVTLNRIFYGPPGTGKTFRTTGAALEILDPGFYEENKTDRRKLRGRFAELRAQGRVEFVTFHQSFGYEEFVEGIRPVMDGKHRRKIEYEVADGVFKRICKAAKDDVDRPYVLIIDEINRGNISRIFGELITLIEESKRTDGPDEIIATLPYSKESFTVPANLHIIGTMNTADRSIALLDTALRRRFKFTEMMPDSSMLAEVVIEDVNISAMLSAINERIEAIYDRDHQIGHTYMLELKKSGTIGLLSDIFRDSILPLLQEYFYDDWEKIDAVLNGNGFVVKSDLPKMKSADSVNRDKKIWRVAGEDAFRVPGNYMKIYEAQPESS